MGADDVRRRFRMTRPPKTATVLFATAIVALAMSASPAAAKKPSRKACWKVLINDWYDGTINGSYPVHCYREALKHLGPDLKGYTKAYDDINRALQQRLARKNKKDTLPVVPGSRPTHSGRPSTTAPKKAGDGGRSRRPKQDKQPRSQRQPAPVAPGRRKKGPANRVINVLGPKDATSIPIPLLVLGGIAVLLMVGGAASFVAKRAQARRIPVPVRPAPPTQPR
jgi:hypothetical protein